MATHTVTTILEGKELLVKLGLLVPESSPHLPSTPRPSLIWGLLSPSKTVCTVLIPLPDSPPLFGTIPVGMLNWLLSMLPLSLAFPAWMILYSLITVACGWTTSDPKLLNQALNWTVHVWFFCARRDTNPPTPLGSGFPVLCVVFLFCDIVVIFCFFMLVHMNIFFVLRFTVSQTSNYPLASLFQIYLLIVYPLKIWIFVPLLLS